MWGFKHIGGGSLFGFHLNVYGKLLDSPTDRLSLRGVGWGVSSA